MNGIRKVVSFLVCLFLIDSPSRINSYAFGVIRSKIESARIAPPRFVCHSFDSNWEHRIVDFMSYRYSNNWNK